MPTLTLRKALLIINLTVGCVSLHAQQDFRNEEATTSSFVNDSSQVYMGDGSLGMLKSTSILPMGFVNESGNPVTSGAPPGGLPAVVTVSPTGAATYTLPIELPAGAGGVRPTLAISYNSQSGIGLLGHGWNLVGISAITRVPRSFYFDGEAGSVRFDAGDRFALDGQRLLLVSGAYGSANAVFGLEREDFSRVTFTGNPANPSSFTKVMHDGTTIIYNRVVVAPGRTSNGNFIWLVGSITDRRGITITYEYEVDNTKGQARLSRITYSGHTVTFNYDTRPVADFHFVGGSRFVRDLVLSTISINNGVTYTFNVSNFNRLTTIEKRRHGLLVSQPTTIQWGEQNAFNYTRISGINHLNNLNLNHSVVGDFTGDGRNEAFLFSPWHDVSGKWALYSLSTSNSLSLIDSGVRPLNSLDTVTHTREICVLTISLWGKETDCNTYHANQLVPLPMVVADVDGDGRMEVCFIEKHDRLYSLHAYHVGPSGLTSAFKRPIPGIVTPGDMIKVADFNGDGIPNVLIVGHDNTLSTNFNDNMGVQRVGIRSSVGGMFIGHFSGSGRAGVLAFNDNNIQVFEAVGSALSSNYTFQVQHTIGVSASHVLPGDYNGDGLTDILLFNSRDSRWELHYATGMGFLRKENANFLVQGNPNDLGFRTPLEFIEHFRTLGTTQRPNVRIDRDIKMNVYIPGDFNGDGKTDVLRMQRGIEIDMDGWGQFSYPFSGTVFRMGNSTSRVPKPTLNDIISYIEDHKLHFYSPCGYRRIIQGGRFEYVDENQQFEFNIMNNLNQEGINLNPGGFGDIQFVFRKGFRQLPMVHGDIANDGINRVMFSEINVHGDITTDSKHLFSLPNDSHRNIVNNITDGQGLQHSFRYSWLNDASIHTITGSSPHPSIRQLRLPLRVVRELRHGHPVDPDSPIAISSYSYRNLWLHPARGVLGFGSITASNAVTGVTTTTTNSVCTTFLTPFPSRVQVTRNGRRISDVRYQHVISGAAEVAGVTGSRRYFMDIQGETSTDIRNLVTSISRVRSQADGSILSEQKTVGGVTMRVEYSNPLSLPNVSSFFRVPRTVTTLRNGTFTNVIHYTFDSRGNVLTESDNGVMTSYEYDANGINVIRITCPLNTITTLTYSGLFLSRRSTLVAGATLVESFERNSDGQVLRHTDINGHVTTYEYNGFGHLVGKRTPDGRLEAYSFGRGDLNTFRSAVCNWGGLVRTRYNHLGQETSREVRRTDGSAETISSTYNVDGSLNSIRSSVHGLTSYTYWPDGRVRRITTPTGSTSYSYFGADVTITLPNGQHITRNYNGLGELIGVRDPGGTISYNMGPFGPTAINANGIVTRIEYHTSGASIGQQHWLHDPSAGSSEFRYDHLGRLIYQRDANGVETTITFNPAGQVESKRAGGRTIRYQYHTNAPHWGLLKKAVDEESNITTRYTYDPLGRVATVTDNIAGVDYTFRYTYDSQGRMVSKVYPSGLTISMTHQGGRLTSIVHDGQSLIGNITYNNRGQVTSYTAGNGHLCVYTYSPNGFLTSIAFGSNDAQRRTFTYNFNEATGNLTSRGRQVGNGSIATETFTYDRVDRLLSWTVGGVERTMQYQADGNIRHKSDMGLFIYHSGRPHAVAAVQTLQGEPVFTEVSNITYNTFNKVATMSSHPRENISLVRNHHAFTYGPDNQRRIMRVGVNLENTTIYTGGGLLEVRPNGDQLHYIPGPAGMAALIVTSKNDATRKDIYYLYTDHLGSLIAAYGSNGALVAEFSYDPWGRRRDPANPNCFNVAPHPLLTRGFTFHEHIPALGMINMNGRMYDPRLGRFFSPDPYVQAPDFTQSFNRYSYVWNNPLKYVDPSGEIVITAILIGAGIGALTGYIGGRAAGLRGGDLAAFTIGAGLIGAISGGVGAGVSAGVTAAFGAGANAFVVGATAGAAGGAVGGFIGGAGLAGLTNATFGTNMNVFSAGLNGALIGGITGGVLGGIGGGLQNRIDGRTFFGGRPTGEGLLAYEYTVDLVTGGINRISDLGGSDLHFYHFGVSTDAGTAFQWMMTEVIQGHNTINAFRFWQSAASTISAFSIPASGLTGYFLEPAGPSTTARGLDRRVPAGTYRLTPNMNRFPDDFMIFNNHVPATRGITIHTGNAPIDTSGCLLPGSSWRPDFVGGSDVMRLKINLQINRVGYRNMWVNIFDMF